MIASTIPTKRKFITPNKQNAWLNENFVIIQSACVFVAAFSESWSQLWLPDLSGSPGPIQSAVEHLLHQLLLFCSHYHQPASGLSASGVSPSHSNSCFSPWASFIPSLVQALTSAWPWFCDWRPLAGLLPPHHCHMRRTDESRALGRELLPAGASSPAFLGVLFRQVIMMLIPYVSWEASRNNPGTCTAPLPELQGCSINIYMEVLLPDTSLSSPD